MFDILVEMDPGLVSVWLILKAHLHPPQGHLCVWGPDELRPVNLFLLPVANQQPVTRISPHLSPWGGLTPLGVAVSSCWI